MDEKIYDVIWNLFVENSKKSASPLRGLRRSVRFLADAYFFAFFSAGSSTMRISFSLRFPKPFFPGKVSSRL